MKESSNKDHRQPASSLLQAIIVIKYSDERTEALL